MIELNRAREQFIGEVREMAAAHFSTDPKGLTTYEHEAALLCLLMSTMQHGEPRAELFAAIERFAKAERRDEALAELLSQLSFLHVERLQRNEQQKRAKL